MCRLARSSGLVAASLLAALTLVSTGCTQKQAKVARTVGKVMSIGGVSGLIGSALAARFVGYGQELLVGFSIGSGVGLVTYAVGELSQPQIVWKEETLTQRHHRWAKILTERAAGAARENRCARVRRLEPRVHRYDAAIHDLVFMRDPEILRCLGQPAPPSGLFPEDAAPTPPIDPTLPVRDPTLPARAAPPIETPPSK